MKEIREYTHLLYDLSAVINKLKMKDIRLQSGVKLNSAAMSLLNVIYLHPGLSVTDLARRLNLTKSAVSQMLKKLCAQELTVKSKNEDNDKTIYPELTEKGRAAAEEYRQKHDGFYACMSDLLNRYEPRDRELICRFLTETVNAVRGFSSTIES